MKRVRVLVITILCLPFIVGCDYIIPHVWRYKITVEIETPEGIKSGSAVRQVTARLLLPITPEARNISHIIEGEAVVVDMGHRGILFDLVGAYDQVQKAFPINETMPLAKRLRYYSSLKKNSISSLPVTKRQFITFADINNPQSIKSINSNELEIVFGQGVRFKNIRIEIVDMAPTFGQIREKLKWFDDKKIGLDRWDPKKPDPANYLTKESFIKGERL